MDLDQSVVLPNFLLLIVKMMPEQVVVVLGDQNVAKLD
jgi:hypothetical protein